MRVKITENQKQVLHAIRGNVRATAEEIAECMGKSRKVLHHLLNEMISEKYGYIIKVADYRKNPTGGRRAPVFELDADLKFMEDYEFEKAIEYRRKDAVKPEKLEPAVRQHQGLKTEQIKKDKQAVEFIRLNSAFFSCVDIGRSIGASPYAVKEVAQELGIDMSDESRHPSAEFISSSMRSIPNGTEISEWQGGTAFHMKSNTPGIKTVTRHFAGA